MASARNNKTLSYAIFSYGLYLPVPDKDFAHKEDAVDSIGKIDQWSTFSYGTNKNRTNKIC